MAAGSGNFQIPNKTIIISQSLTTSTSFTVDLHTRGLNFIPKYVIVRQLIYANVAGNDNGTFLIWSSLVNDFIAAVYVGVQSDVQTPQTIIPITHYTPSVHFNVTAADGTFNDPVALAPTGNLTMTLEFY